MEFALINKLIVIFISIITFWLAFTVLFANWRAKVNKIFFVMTILLIPWLILDYLFFFEAKTPEQALNLIRGVYGVITFWFIPAYYFFVVHFPRESEKRYPILDKFVVTIVTILSLICFFTNLGIKDIEFREGYPDIIFGSGANIYFGTIFLLIIFYLVALLKKYFKPSEQEKLKVQYVLVGAFIFGLTNIILNIVLSFLQRTTRLYTLVGDYSTIFFIGFTAYAILKQQLFGIKIILTHLLLGVMGIILLILPFLIDILWVKTLLFIVFFLFSVFSYFSIKGISREIKEKEILEQKVKKRTKELEEAKTSLEEAKTVLEIKVKARTKELEELAKGLDEKVKERTKELQERVNELERFRKLTVGRELKMMELKKEIKKLEKYKGRQ